MASCFQLKHTIQDLIDNGLIAIDSSHLTSNSDHTIFKDPLGDPDKGKASSSGTTSQPNVSYTRTSHDYTINCFHESDSCIATFTLKKEDPRCAVTTHRSKITLPRAPTRPIAASRPTAHAKPTTPSDYNLVDQLGKTPT